MRIFRESDLQVLWSWGETERGHLQRTFQSNLVELLKTVQTRARGSQPLPPGQIDELAREVQEAGELLEQGMNTCFALAGILYVMGGKDSEEQAQRQEHLNRLSLQKGERVRVVKTSIQELLDRKVLLEDIHGFKAVLWDGEGRWETPIDRIEPIGVPQDTAVAEAGPEKHEAVAARQPETIKPGQAEDETTDPPEPDSPKSGKKPDTTVVGRRQSRTEKARKLTGNPLQQPGTANGTQTRLRLRKK